MSDAIISYKGQTIRVANVTIRPASHDITSFTNEQLEESSRLMDGMWDRLKEDRAKAFFEAHPNGGTFYYLPDGTLFFVDAKPQIAEQLASPGHVSVSITRRPV